MFLHIKPMMATEVMYGVRIAVLAMVRPLKFWLSTRARIRPMIEDKMRQEAA